MYAEGGESVPALCSEQGMSGTKIYKLRAKYGGMDASLIKRMKELDDESQRLKRMYVEHLREAGCGPRLRH
jgi:putative transposase